MPMGNLEDAFSLYEQAIAIEKGREHPLVLPAFILDIFFLCNGFFLLLFNADIKKLSESQEGSSENARFSKPLLEALIHLETFLPQPKQIDYLDSLVDNFILTRSESVNPASASERKSYLAFSWRILFLSIHMERKRILQLHFPLHFGETVVTEPPAVMNSNNAAWYDSAVDGNTSTEAGVVLSDENGNAGEVVGGADAVQQFEDGSVPEISAEEDRLWSIVKANSLDFDAWIALLDETEKVAGYADHEARLGFMDKVVEVYERAVLGSRTQWTFGCIIAYLPYPCMRIQRPLEVLFSVSNLWNLCIDCAVSIFISTYVFWGIRLFERGLVYVGTDYLSYPLWDKYIEYEELRAEWGCVAMIYARILEIPNRKLDDYFNRFEIHVWHIYYFIPCTFTGVGHLKASAAAAAGACTLLEDGGQAEKGEVHPDAAERPSKPVSAGLGEAEEVEKHIVVREEIYKKAKEFDSKISDFENAIRRPYFHVRPLNVTELENWHNYLDMIEREDDFISIWVSSCLPNHLLSGKEGPSFRVCGPFCSPMECIIACANYTEYWIRYVLCMEACGNMNLANNALARATQVFVKGAGNFTASFVAAQAAYTGNAYGSMDRALVGTDSTINNAAVTENASFVSPQAAGYDSAVDGNTSTEAGVVLSDENGNAGEVVGGADAVQQFEDGSVPEMSAEEDRLWSIVKANSLDFDAWIALLDETEKVAGYADHEARLVLWTKLWRSMNGLFLGHVLSGHLVALLHICISMYEDPETIRSNSCASICKMLLGRSHQIKPKMVYASFRSVLLLRVNFVPSPSVLFERGLVYVGTNYLSYPLWDKYIEYEELHAEWGSVAMIYARILEIPNRKLDDYFNSSKSELKKSDAEDYLSSDGAKIAKPYSDGTSPPQSLMGAYTSAHNQWTAGYGLQPQAWPPATQVQTQQWTPGFNQQVAYGGYGGSYTCPQVPTSVAQVSYQETHHYRPRRRGVMCIPCKSLGQ
uniref:Uncharacterized protein n=1 Tax=Salix viminalis TaxID=40686 RepID=A0A6N2MZ43_SALVM